MNNREAELEKLVVNQALEVRSLEIKLQQLHDCILEWENLLKNYYTSNGTFICTSQFDKLQTEMRAVAATLVHI